jgi:hypothetical protein
MKWIALAGAALAVCTGPASATMITNTFIGTIVYSDNTGFDPTTTDDIGNYFGGGNLIGASFTLTLTLDSSTVDPNNPSFVTGTGGNFYFYSSPNPISAVLTINNISFAIADTSDAYYGDSGFGANEKSLQAFNYNPGYQLQTEAINVDLTTTANTSTDLRTPLPAMLLSNNDYVNNFASFAANMANGFLIVSEVLNLNVEAVNTSLPTTAPEPSSLAIFGAGLAALGLARRRRSD